MVVKPALQKTLEKWLEPNGLAVLGWFAMVDGPPGLDGHAAVLIGNRGGAMWQMFQMSAVFADGEENRLDRWTRDVIGPLALSLNATAFYPFLNEEQLHHWPFQKWAMMALGLKQSPPGLLIDPQYGLWQAFRAALVFDETCEAGAGRSSGHPCDACQNRPCLFTCPVNAISGAGFDVAVCRSHLAASQGATCMNNGCIARNACPVGREYAYCEEQQAFHMAALGVA